MSNDIDSSGIVIATRFTEYLAEQKELFKKYKIDFVNEDAYDEGTEEYLGTDVYYVMEGRVLHGSSLHELLADLLQAIYDETDGQMYSEVGDEKSTVPGDREVN